MIDYFTGEYEFLSNFYPSRISDGYLSFPTVEHYFQASKTSGMYDYMRIAQAETPSEAKRIGKNIPLPPNWEDIKDEKMEIALRKKFAIPILKEKLLATGDEYLEEGNTWHDNYWGVCHCPNCNNIKAQNNLGKMLMKIRKEISEDLNNVQNK